MAKEIRARFSKKVIEPLEKVELEEGEEIIITISKQEKGKGMIEALCASAGGWKT
jgi:predicted DNA-binding antitoxin AbrB/MazE fold protein